MMKILEKEKALHKIEQQIQNCKICKKDKIGKAVPGEGNANADIVFLGEAPGKKESITGKPFIGPAGKILRQLIAKAGLKDSDIFITSPVKYLPIYVTPTLEDIAHGKTHLLKQLKVINPKIVVIMGKVAAIAMLNKSMPIAKEHGKIIRQDNVTYLITYHPAAPLYNPKIRTELEKDFKKLKKLISHE